MVGLANCLLPIMYDFESTHVMQSTTICSLLAWIDSMSKLSHSYSHIPIGDSSASKGG